MHVKCGMSKKEWERVKALPSFNPRMIHKSCDAYMIPHPTKEGIKVPFSTTRRGSSKLLLRGVTYNVGNNKIKRMIRLAEKMS